MALAFSLRSPTMGFHQQPIDSIAATATSSMRLSDYLKITRSAYNVGGNCAKDGLCGSYRQPHLSSKWQSGLHALSASQRGTTTFIHCITHTTQYVHYVYILQIMPSSPLFDLYQSRHGQSLTSFHGHHVHVSDLDIGEGYDHPRTDQEVVRPILGVQV